MNTYFEVGIRYDKTMENGAIKKVTENYLLEAISFTEAESRAIEKLKAYTSGELSVISEKITNISEVVTTDNATADKFYRVKQISLPLMRKMVRRKSKHSISLFKLPVWTMLATDTNNILRAGSLM